MCDKITHEIGKVVKKLLGESRGFRPKCNKSW